MDIRSITNPGVMSGYTIGRYIRTGIVLDLRGVGKSLAVLDQYVISHENFSNFNGFWYYRGGGFMRLLLLITLVITGCASTQKNMDSWLGHHKKDVIAEWGPPAKTDSDGDGGEVLTWSQDVSYGQRPGYIQSYGNGTASYTAPTTNQYSRVRQFYVNKDGVIYSHRWQGN